MDLACSWKMEWSGGGTFTEMSMLSRLARLSRLSMASRRAWQWAAPTHAAALSSPPRKLKHCKITQNIGQNILMAIFHSWMRWDAFKQTQWARHNVRLLSAVSPAWLVIVLVLQSLNAPLASQPCILILSLFSGLLLWWWPNKDSQNSPSFANK